MIVRLDPETVGSRLRSDMRIRPIFAGYQVARSKVEWIGSVVENRQIRDRTRASFSNREREKTRRVRDRASARARRRTGTSRTDGILILRDTSICLYTCEATQAHRDTGRIAE